MPFGVAQEIKRRKTALRISDDALQKIAKVAEHPPNGRVLKKVGAVVAMTGERALLLFDAESEVEFRGPRFHWNRIQGQPPEGQWLGSSALEGHHDLEQRVTAQVALGPQFLHQLLERKVLMGVGSQRNLPNPPQQLPKPWGPREIASQGQGVGEETDEALDLCPTAVGDRDPDDDVFLARVAGQQRLETPQAAS